MHYQKYDHSLGHTPTMEPSDFPRPHIITPPIKYGNAITDGRADRCIKFLRSLDFARVVIPVLLYIVAGVIIKNSCPFPRRFQAFHLLSTKKSFQVILR